MSTRYWLGTAPAVPQVANCTFETYDAATTRSITIGGVVVSAVDSGGTLTAALTALKNLLNASTHPYFAAITWTSDATKIYGTADVAGVPFVFLGGVSGGTGTCSNTYTATTVASGPNDWSTAANWSSGAVPVNSDDVIIKDSSVPILWGLDQSAVSLASLRIEKTYTGKIGLDRTVFVTSSDGGTTSTTLKTEYRECYLKIGSTTVRIGEHYSTGSPNGSSRILINLGSVAATVEIFGTAQSSSEIGRPAVRLLFNSASSGLYVRNAPGGVGVAVDAPGETATIGVVSVSDTSTTSRVTTGPGVTLTTWFQQGGVNVLQAAATVTTCTVNGGDLTIEGDFTITTMELTGGTVKDNHVKSGGNAITTLNLDGGTVDAQGSNRARTWDTVNWKKGVLKADGTILTQTTINDKAGKYTVTIS